MSTKKQFGFAASGLFLAIAAIPSEALSQAGTGFVARPYLFQADRARLLASIAANDPEATGSGSNDLGQPIGFITMANAALGNRSSYSDLPTWHLALAGWISNSTALCNLAVSETNAKVASDPDGYQGTSSPFQHIEEEILDVAGVVDLCYSRFTSAQLAAAGTWVTGTLNNWNQRNTTYWPFDDPHNNYWQNGFLAFAVAGIGMEGIPNANASQWRAQTVTMANKFRAASASPTWNGPVQTEGHYYSNFVSGAVWAMQLHDNAMGTNLLASSGFSPRNQLNLVMFQTRPNLTRFFEVGSEASNNLAVFTNITLRFWYHLITLAPQSEEAKHAKAILKIAELDNENFFPRSMKGFVNFYWNIRSVATVSANSKPERFYRGDSPGSGLIGLRSSAGFSTGARAALMFAHKFNTSPAYSHSNPDAPGFQWAAGNNWLVTDPEYFNSSGILAEAGSGVYSDVSNIVTLAGQQSSENGGFPIITYQENNTASGSPHYYIQINAQPYWNSASYYRRDYVWLDDLQVVIIYDHVTSPAAKKWRLHLPAGASISGNTATYTTGGTTVRVRNLYSSGGSGWGTEGAYGAVRLFENDSSTDYRSVKVLDAGGRVTSATLSTASGSLMANVTIGGGTTSATFYDDGRHALVSGGTPNPTDTVPPSAPTGFR